MKDPNDFIGRSAKLKRNRSRVRIVGHTQHGWKIVAADLIFTDKGYPEIIWEVEGKELTLEPVTESVTV